MGVELLLPMITGPVVMALVLVIARAAAAGRITRNHSVGIRLPSTLASDAAWREGHRTAMRPAASSVVALVVADVVAVLLARSGTPADAVGVGVGVLLVLAIVRVVLAAATAARRAAPGDPALGGPR